MSSYLLIDIVILIFPLILTVLGFYSYKHRLKFVFFSTLIVSTVYILLDMLSVYWGFWRFNAKHVFAYRIVNLPFEEIVFFIVIPFSCLFIYHILEGKLRTIENAQPSKIFIINFTIITLICLTTVFYLQEKTRSALDIILIILFLLADKHFKTNLIFQKHYWIFMAIGFVLFFIFNYILTSLPILIYNESFSTGIRITTIPIEDFLYNYSLLSFYVLFYGYFKAKSNELK